MYSEAEERIDQVFLEAFETNHPAMLDWVSIKFELKDLRAKVAMQNTSNNSQSTPCVGCTDLEECQPCWGEEHPACYKD